MAMYLLASVPEHSIREEVEAHLIALTLQTRGRDIGKTQSLLSRALGIRENESVAGENAFDVASQRLRHGVAGPSTNALEQGNGIDVHEQ